MINYQEKDKMKPKTNIDDLFRVAKDNGTYVKVSAPMVRYSKVQFRTLVKMYGVDLCFTPMILADSFCQNSKARASEFSTTHHDSPLIVQFAANNANDFLDATELLSPYADGVDLNCGCPQRWAMKDGYGCSLLNTPQVIFDLVKSVRNTHPTGFSISVKIRILSDLNKTIELCQQMEKCGVNFITVHGRTPAQKSSGYVNTVALREVCDSVQVPIIANGGVKTLKEADQLHESTRCHGVMAASALLTNPALFSGFNQTPLSCVKLWKDLKDRHKDNITFQCYHHHLVFMLEKVLNREQKQMFNVLSTFETVDEYVNEYLLNTVYDKVELSSVDEFITCEFDEEITRKHSKKCRKCCKSVFYCTCNDSYDSNAAKGSFFCSHVKQSDAELDVLDYGNLFDEQ